MRAIAMVASNNSLVWGVKMFKTALYLACAAAAAIASPAYAAKELNLAVDGATNPSETALVVTDRQAGRGISMTVTWLLHITDLSTPEAERKPVKLFSAWSALAGKYPRVSPGPYRINVGCDGGGFKQSYEDTIDAKPGKAYVVSCSGATPHSTTAGIQEINQADLPGKV